MSLLLRCSFGGHLTVAALYCDWLHYVIVRRINYCFGGGVPLLDFHTWCSKCWVHVCTLYNQRSFCEKHSNSRHPSKFFPAIVDV